jgi:putative transposase
MKIDKTFRYCLRKLILITNIYQAIMPFISVNIHFVWSTKNRLPFLATREQRQTLWHHIKQNAEEKNIHIDFVNGYTDHCHCLVSMDADQTMSKVMQLIKGESSFWVNKTQLCAQKFEWQDEYFAVSVSKSQLETVRNYIRNQEQHHSKKTFQDEYEEFMQHYGFHKFKDSSI